LGQRAGGMEGRLMEYMVADAANMPANAWHTRVAEHRRNK